MSWRIVSVSSLAKLYYKMDYLVVRTQDSVRRVHLSEISVLLIYRKLCLLLLEAAQPSRALGEAMIVIDRDLCVL